MELELIIGMAISLLFEGLKMFPSVRGRLFGADKATNKARMRGVVFGVTFVAVIIKVILADEFNFVDLSSGIMAALTASFVLYKVVLKDVETKYPARFGV